MAHASLRARKVFTATNQHKPFAVNVSLVCSNFPLSGTELLDDTEQVTVIHRNWNSFYIPVSDSELSFIDSH